MSTYIQNKLLSFLVVFSCIAVTYALFGATTKQWQVILMIIVVFGYGHFLLGFYYQIKSFFRKKHPWRYVGTFMFLVAVSVVLAYVLIYAAGFVAALFAGFFYFLLHGLLNEQTLIQRQTGHVVPIVFLSALAVFVMSLLTYSVPDETFFFNRSLQFTPMNDALLLYAFEHLYISLEHFSQIFFIGLGTSAALLAYGWYRYRHTLLTIFLACVLGAATFGVLLFGPPAYIYMYLFVVGYHFVTWFLFYVVEMKKRSGQHYRNFILQHIVVLCPFAVAGYLFFTPSPPLLAMWLFDYQLFVVATYIHISTSFMNDAWLIAWQDRFYQLFSR